MSEPTDLDIDSESREADVELGPRPRTLALEVELTMDELKHIRRGIGTEAKIIHFLKSAALKEADRLAIANEHDGRYQFEYWALGLVDARPAAGGKKGADSGVDGYINFFDDNSNKASASSSRSRAGTSTEPKSPRSKATWNARTPPSASSSHSKNQLTP